jgi:sulfite reductase alpha subunit-like flavoprotein
MQICVLYGSQTGNSKCIAEEFASRCNDELNMPVLCDSLNSIKEDINELNHKFELIFVICSTTGNGDMPDNACQFWKIVKNRALPKTFFEDMKYSVLALGDTNYDKYCIAGKNIDKRLHELGGIRCIDLCCVDEASDSEESIAEWLKTAFEYCKNRSSQYS